MSFVAITAVLAGCGGTITPTPPTGVSVPTTETTRGTTTDSAASHSARVTTSIPSAGGNGGAVSTSDAPGGDGQRPGGQPGNGGILVSPLKVSEYIQSQGVLWAQHKPILDGGIADYCSQAHLPANCVRVDVDSSGDPGLGYGACAIHDYKYHEPVYPGDRITVILESPCSDDGLTAGEGGAGGTTDITDPTDITDGTDTTEGTDSTDLTDTTGADAAGGESTTSQ